MTRASRNRTLRSAYGASLSRCRAPAEGAARWEYDGAHSAEKWGELDPAYKACSIGGAQSPIDLSGAIPAKIEHLSLDWKPQAFAVQNNGHTIQADASPGSFAVIGKDRYELKQFHFHTSSERALGGVRAAMEAHFVHVLEGGGGLAVAGAFLNSGGANAALSQIMQIAPTKEGAAMLGRPLDPKALLPTQGALYRYEGSLTPPPCSETVQWNVFAAAVAVSAVDIEAFKKIFPNNARPLQPLNRRFLLQEG